MRGRRGILIHTAPVAVAALALITCSRNLLDPEELELARGHGFLSDSLISSVTDTAGLAVVDTVEPGDTVYFAGLVTAHEEELRAEWRFGDGASAGGTSASHVYTGGGTYTARFTISDDAGNAHTDTVVVHVNTSPSIRGGGNGLVDPPDNQRNLDPAEPVHFAWTFTDPDSGDTLLSDLYLGTSRDIAEPAVAAIDSTSLDTLLSGPATYYWFIVVHDRFGRADTSAVHTFTVAAPSDTSGAKPRITGNRPTDTVTTRVPEVSATFTGKAIDPTTAIVRFDGVEVTAEATVTAGGFTWQPPERLGDGVHTVRVTVADTSGRQADPLEWSFTVDAMILVARGDTTVTAGETVTLEATVSGVYSAVADYRWDLDGDGEWDTIMVAVDTTVSIQHAYDRNDTYEAVVSARDDSGTTKRDTVKVFVTSTDPVIQSIRGDTTISIGDSVFFTARARDLDGRIDRYAWDFDGDGTFDAVSEESAEAGYRYDSAGTYTAVLQVKDNGDNRTTDSVVIRVVRDAPAITYLSADTVVAFGGTVRCSVAIEQSFGTVTVEIDTAGTGTYVPIADEETYATYRIATGTASSWDSVKVRVTDDDGNRVTGGFAVDIRPRKLTITRVDSTDSTVSVRYTKTKDTDFAEYRIYYDTSAEVDAGGKLWARIAHAGTVSHTDTPSYLSRPRYYRVYQVDEEGLWSPGSNIVFGDITVTPPTEPTIVYPAADGDTVWANDVLRWKRSSSVFGEVVYRVLVNPNDNGYVVLADALTDTFLVLTGYDQSDLEVDIRVVAHDGRTEARSQRESIIVRRTVEGRMRIVPAGSFVNGAGESVTIDHSFWMDTTEVTQGRFAALLGGYNPSRFSGVNRPVEQVTWYEAIAYCNARSKAEELDTVYSYAHLSDQGAAGLNVHWERNGYRLPTENEWEMAGRGGRGLLYPTDDGTISEDKANYRNLYTVSVATYPPNPYGLYNMAGNVSEWCWDELFSNRVARGGDWSSRNTAHLRVTRRNPAEPSTRDPSIGLRCVRLAR